jgi:hypothetical protein
MPKVEEKHEEPKEEVNGVMPSPLTASSVASQQATEEETASEEPKNFIKTGLAGNGGMAGIPANPSYGLGGERTLKNSVNHSETKTTESVPEPVNTANITVPKFGSSSDSTNNSTNNGTTANTTASSIPAFASALSNNSSASTANATATSTAIVTDSAAKNEQKPGIYKVSADNKLYNANNSANNTTNTTNTTNTANTTGSVNTGLGGGLRGMGSMGGMGLAPSSNSTQNNNAPKPGIYKVGADNKLTAGSNYAPKAEQSDTANTNANNNANANANASNATGMSKPGIYKVTDQQ